MSRKPVAPPADLAPDPVPVPNALRWHAWFPASVVLPGEGRRPRHRVKVFATDLGLYVYDRQPADLRQVERIDAVWFSPIDYDKTPRPPSDIMGKNGFQVVTAAGVVTITTTGGCGCNQKTLKGWAPEWATTVQAWTP